MALHRLRNPHFPADSSCVSLIESAEAKRRLAFPQNDSRLPHSALHLFLWRFI